MSNSSNSSNNVRNIYLLYVRDFKHVYTFFIVLSLHLGISLGRAGPEYKIKMATRVVCSCSIFFFLYFQRIPSDMNSLLQRVLHCAGYALGFRLKAFTMQLSTCLFKVRIRPAILQCSVRALF